MPSHPIVRSRLVLPLLAGALALALAATGRTQAPAAPAAGPGLTLTTPAFADGAEIPARHTQVDPNHPISPRLEWTHVPAGTVSFALLMHDPDVALMRTTEDVLHWFIFNLPGEARALPEGVPPTATLPDGSVQILNRGGVPGYRGPGAPAAGPQHHYTFELFALDVKLDLPPTATRAEVMKAMEGHILGKGVLMGRFKRPTPAAAPAR